MKKLALIVILLIAITSLTFAGDVFSFSIAPITPIYKESVAYTFSNSVRFSYLKTPSDAEYAINALLVSKENEEGNVEYASLPFKDADAHNTSFWYMKSASDIALLRFSWKNYIT